MSGEVAEESIHLTKESFEAVIGLEVHAQLKTRSKAFCSCSTDFGAEPNTNTCPVCLGLPGALPTFNRRAVEFSVMMGLATNCSIRERSGFSRKNYFYPDLPKGYQISQFDDPICFKGHVEIEQKNGSTKTVGITRIHMEEDSGKSIHDLDIDTLVDLNRSGTPLIEIVSEPDIRSAEEAYKYLNEIRRTLMYLGICDGNMEEGSLRCDANVSVKPKNQTQFGTRTEIKNLNSFRNVEKAIEFEISRQIDAILAGETITQETRMWDAGANVTKVMRSKEQAHDYRYFPEPDLAELVVSEEWRDKIKSELPELPLQKKRRFIAEYGLPAYDSGLLVDQREMADYFELTCSSLAEKNFERFKLVSNWIMTEVMRYISERKISITEFPVAASAIAELVDLFAEDIISSKIAKDIFPEVLLGKSPKIVVEERGLSQISDVDAIREIVRSVVASNPDNVAKHKTGRGNVFGFFVGQVLQKSGGKANPRIVNDLLKQELEKA